MSEAASRPQDSSLFVGPDDVVIVPADDDTAGRAALAADEPLTQESLEELMEGAPPAAEELVHEVPAGDVPGTEHSGGG